MNRSIFFKIGILALFILSFSYVNAQYQNLGDATPSKKSSKPNPWFVGGMIGGSFSNYGGSFEISPLVGYRVTEDFHVGSRLTYIYTNIDYGGTIGKRSFHDYGASIFARYRFIPMLFGHAEYEILNVQYPRADGTIDNILVNSLFLGGGLYQQMGGRGFATIAMLFNVMDSQYSPYSNPIIRVGFGVGL